MFSKLSRAASIAATVAFAFTAVSGAHAGTLQTHHLQAPLRGANALQPVGKLPATQVLTLDVVLPLRDPDGLNAFLMQLYNPSSPIYKQYLTPSDFAARFGPTLGDYQTVVTFLKANGFEVYGGTFLGHEVQVKAPVSVIESTFHVSMNVYQHPTENRTFYSPDREPTPSVSVPLWHISGLDNFSIPKPKLVNRDQYAKAKGISPQTIQPDPRAGSGGSGPNGSFLGSDMRAAYYSTGPGAGTLTGTGQNLGLFEYYGTDLVDLTTYFTNVGQTNNVPITLLSTDGTSTACVYSQGCDDGEQNLDMTQAIGMAPGLASLVMYVGSTDTAMISAMTTHNPLPTTIGCSWGWTPADATTLDPYFLQMSAQGQNFFVASGDDSTWTKNGNAEAWPADDANIVAVGGTDLKTSTPAGPWASETAWSDSGGGSSPDKVALPSYQNVPSVLTGLNNASTTLRNGPDVSANANFTFYTCGDQEACQANYYGGTSFAAPMWAAYIALVNQALVAAKYPTVGFLNPTIYTMNADSTAYATNFHDITSGTSGSYSTALGFDLVTGWGTPTPYLESAIVSTTTNVNTPDFSLTPFSTGYVLTTTPSTPSVTDALTLASINSLAGTVNLTCSGNGGLTCSLSPTSTSLTAKGTASSTLTVNGSAVPVAGTYTVIVTATSGSDVHSASVDVYAPGSALSIADNSSGTITIASPGATGSTTLTLTPSGFVSGATALSCTITSAPTGAINLPTCSVTPSVTLAITTSGTGTLTINTTASHFKSGAQQSSLSVKHTPWLAGGLFLALLLVPVRRRRLPLLAMLFVSALLLSNVVGCSGSAPKGATSGVPGTTAGTYAVTVTGTVGTVTATHTVTINVQ